VRPDRGGHIRPSAILLLAGVFDICRAIGSFEEDEFDSGLTGTSSISSGSSTPCDRARTRR